MLGVGRKEFLPTPTGQRHCPFLILEGLKCNDDPFPFAEGSLPRHSKALGRSRQGLGAKLERPAVASPDTLGDQMYLMVKGLVPSLTRASDGARDPPT